MVKTKSPSWVWMRLGDNADYEKFDDLFAAGEQAGYHLVGINKIPEIGRVNTYGVAIPPYFTGNNYVSLFWGDNDAQPVKAVTVNELVEFKQGIREGADLPATKKTKKVSVKKRAAKKYPSGLGGLR